MLFHVGFILLLGLTLLFILYRVKKDRWLFSTSLISFLVLFISVPFFYFDTLSRPKNLTEEYFRNDKETPVLNYVVKPGVGLYVLLDLKGIKEPRYYKIPWNENTRKIAEELQKGMKQKRQMALGFPFEKSLEKKKPLTTYPLPQFAPPPKDLPKKIEKNIPEYSI